MKPYRVEWRHDLVTNWLLIKDRDTTAEAYREATESLKKWGGQCRVIEQKVSYHLPNKWSVARKI